MVVRRQSSMRGKLIAARHGARLQNRHSACARFSSLYASLLAAPCVVRILYWAIETLARGNECVVASSAGNLARCLSVKAGTQLKLSYLPLWARCNNSIHYTSPPHQARITWQAAALRLVCGCNAAGAATCAAVYVGVELGHLVGDGWSVYSLSSNPPVQKPSQACYEFFQLLCVLAIRTSTRRGESGVGLLANVKWRMDTAFGLRRESECTNAKQEDVVALGNYGYCRSGCVSSPSLEPQLDTQLVAFEGANDTPRLESCPTLRRLADPRLTNGKRYAWRAVLHALSPEHR